jgi:hypothetical protein
MIRPVTTYFRSESTSISLNAIWPISKHKCIRALHPQSDPPSSSTKVIGGLLDVDDPDRIVRRWLLHLEGGGHVLARQPVVDLLDLDPVSDDIENAGGRSLRL